MPARSRQKEEEGPVVTMKHTLYPPYDHTLWSVGEYMDDVVTEDLNLRLKKGEIINNPVTHVKTTRSNPGGGSYHAYRKSNGQLAYTSLGNGSLTEQYRQQFYTTGVPIPIPSIDLEDLKATAGLNALAQIDTSPYSIAEDIGEIRETLRFLSRPFKDLDSLTKDFQRQWKSLTRRPLRESNLRRSQAIASTFLEYRFALSPLVRSAHTLYESLGKVTKRRYDLVHHAYGQSRKVTATDSDDLVTAPFHWNRTMSYEVQAKASIQYRVKPVRNEWQYKYGLRHKDIPELLWDLFPLSFMYDRIIDIGSGIRALTNLLDSRITIVGATVSLTSKSKQTLALYKQDSGVYDVIIVPDTTTWETEEYVRELWTPTMSDVIPPLTLGGLTRDATKIADLCAIILTRIR